MGDHDVSESVQSRLHSWSGLLCLGEGVAQALTNLDTKTECRCMSKLSMQLMATHLNYSTNPPPKAYLILLSMQQVQRWYSLEWSIMPNGGLVLDG